MIFLDKNKGGKVEVQYRGVTTNIKKKILKAHTKLFLTSDHCCTKGVLAIHPSDIQEAMMTSASVAWAVYPTSTHSCFFTENKATESSELGSELKEKEEL